VAEVAERERPCEDGENHQKQQPSVTIPLDSCACVAGRPVDCQCCVDDEAHQPATYNYSLTTKQCGKQRRKFDEKWFSKWPWLSLCEIRNKVLCARCKWMDRSNKWPPGERNHQETAFVVDGFNAWQVAASRFSTHENSSRHRSAELAWQRRTLPTAATLISSQHAAVQRERFASLCAQISSLRYLARQGLAMRGHTDNEGNLQQLIALRSSDAPRLRSWLDARKFMSHDVVNEQLKLMSLDVLRALLENVRQAPCFSVIADETRDMSGLEQFSVSVRWLDVETCDVREDCIGLVSVETTDSATLAAVIKDTLLRCNLDMNVLVGQGYDGASNMSGRIHGVATRISDEYPAALYVHCNNHCLQLCVQDAASESRCVQDALNVCSELYNVIKLSPKRLAVFEKMRSLHPPTAGSQVSIKPLCPTRWTVRSKAISSVLDNYDALQDTLDCVIGEHKRDEIAAKASGVMTQLEKFHVFFGLYLAKAVFSASDQTANSFQGKDITASEASSLVSSLRRYLLNMRDSFASFWEDVCKVAAEKEIPIDIPRQRKRSKKVDDTASSHTFGIMEYYRQQSYAVIDCIVNQIETRFSQATLKKLVSIEALLLDAANDKVHRVTDSASDSVDPLCFYASVLDLNRLDTELKMLPDVLKTISDVNQTANVRSCTSVRSLATTLHGSPFAKSLCANVFILCAIYMTIPMTSATAERSFSTMRRIKTYLRQTMTQTRLNSCMMLHIHKDKTDSIDIHTIARSFVNCRDERIQYFGQIK
jgi:hypothetical protein